jgi:hypothetical protein
MAMEKAEESKVPSERHLQIVGFDVPPAALEQHVPLHLVASVQDGPHLQAAGYSL